MNINEILISKLQPFEGHPYKVLDNEEMNELTASVLEQGIVEPVLVRPLENTSDEYEIISGHRRIRAAQKAGLQTVPVLIRPMTHDEAAVMVVDSNLHREHLLPSEKAFAYKLKADALNHQGKRSGITSERIAPKLSTAMIAEQEGVSKDVVKRYIRLTYLIPELLDMMDEGKIAFSIGVEISYLSDELQYVLLGHIEELDCTPSYSQAWQMHKDYTAGMLTEESILSRMREPKPNQKETVKIETEKIRTVIPKNVSDANIENFIMKACEHYTRTLSRQRSRDAR